MQKKLATTEYVSESIKNNVIGLHLDSFIKAPFITNGSSVYTLINNVVIMHLSLRITNGYIAKVGDIVLDNLPFTFATDSFMFHSQAEGIAFTTNIHKNSMKILVVNGKPNISYNAIIVALIE